MSCDFHPGFQAVTIFANRPGGLELCADGNGGFASIIRGSLLAELGLELWRGDPARIRAATAASRGPTGELSRILMPSPQERDRRQLPIRRVAELRRYTLILFLLRQGRWPEFL